MKESINDTVIFSFVITYILLLTTATITFIEAMRTKFENIRHILNLETAISVIAGYFYTKFLEKIHEPTIDWKELTKMRYVDWSITTPLMLLVLCVVLGTNTKVNVHWKVIGGIVLLDYLMLFAGYLGEIGTISRWTAMGIGFIALYSIFTIVYQVFMKVKYVFANSVLYWLYAVIWSFYGIFYMLDETYKNIGMNILDLIAKCFVGLGLWLYFVKLIR
jgi:bacteriorhodopsin